MTAVTKQYNYCLDFIKGIACIFVVFLHCEFPGTTGVVVQAFSRYCVPLFFMVSGYYYLSEKTLDVAERKRKAWHIGKITAWATLFYILFGIVRSLITHTTWADFSIYNIVAFLGFNQMFFVVSQMWFLYALLYVYVALIFLNQDWYRRYSVRIAVICITLYVLLAQGLHVVGIYVPNFVYKNWLIEGFGFFTIGFVLHQYQERIRVSNKVLIGIVVLTSLLCVFERYLLRRDFGVNICSIPQVLALMLYAINNPSRHAGAIQRLGRDYSMMVYILHPAIWHSMDGIYQYIEIWDNMPAQYLKPIVVVGLSILLAIAFNKIVKSHNQRIATKTA